MIRATRRLGSRAVALVATALALLLATPAGAPIVSRSTLKSFFLASAGSTATDPHATDVEIRLTYTAGLAGLPSGSGTTTALYLYDDQGEPLLSGTGQVVCAPCLFASGGADPRRSRISVDDLILARGGFASGNQAQAGFLVLDVFDDADHLTAEVRIHTTTGAAGQPHTTVVHPRDVLEDCHEIGDEPRVYVESNLDGITDWSVGDWVIFNGTYLGGIGNVPPGSGATLEVYLFDEDGSPSGGQTPVCAPCSYPLGNGGVPGPPRNVALRFPPTPTSSGAGFAVVRVAGADPSAVVLEETQVDSIPGVTPILKVTASRHLESLVPQAGTTAVSLPDVPGAALALRASPNPSGGAMTFAFELERATSIDLDVFDAAGRRVASVASGPRSAGRHELRWNRRDVSGGPLPAGVYYGLLRAGDGSRITRVVFLPE